ncbi:MAG: triose-phosphate isomerase [Planctomycetes bacterium]|jgi:triosephosphate isomerase|nr:triose-phosphate isomerase [Planctomycetota bacterium]
MSAPRRPFLAGNWKMHGTREEAARLARELRGIIGGETERDVAVFPPFTALAAVREALEGSPIGLGAQNCHPEVKGAFTGEISAPMLRDAGCAYVLVGHSERRQLFGETDDTVARKLRAALAADLRPVLCVGETLEERKGGRTEETVRRQIEAALASLSPADLERITIAYEPVWAIGTGLTATPAQAQEVHGFLRVRLRALFPTAVADRTRIQYGGSVKPDNIDGLMLEPDVDGALVGGASLSATSFGAIVRYGRG